MEESAGSGIQQEVDAYGENENQITESHSEANSSAEKENQITESHKEADTSSGNVNRSTRSADNIIEVIESLLYSSVVSHGKNKIRISRVPQLIRSVNPQAYTPMVVSIGPIHCSDERFQNLEKLKVVYLRSFLSRKLLGVGQFVSSILMMEETVRCCYSESRLHIMDSDDFVRMILLDAIFILELFHRYSLNDFADDDPLQTNGWMFPFVMRDLVLFENQLPFFVLEELFNLAPSPGCPSNYPSLNRLTFNFFGCFNVQRLDPENVKIEHLTDMIRAFQLPSNPLFRRPSRVFVPLLYSATELHDAGVKFVRSSSICLLDLHFEKGVLKMPSLVLDDQSEALVRNVIALEQFCPWGNVCLTDYYVFLDSLINTIDDINLLCDRGILVINNLGGDIAALIMVKKLVTNVTSSGMFSDIPEICIVLNKFYDAPWNRWKAIFSVTTLKNQYFCNPWRGAASIAACVLLLLTFVQTITSVLQVVKS